MFFSGLEKAYVYQYGESLVVGKTEGEYPEFQTLALLNISFFIFQMISKRKPKIQVFFFFPEWLLWLLGYVQVCFYPFSDCCYEYFINSMHSEANSAGRNENAINIADCPTSVGLGTPWRWQMLFRVPQTYYRMGCFWSLSKCCMLERALLLLHFLCFGRRDLGHLSFLRGKC